jgi:uncharacterized protein YbjT (DUF2867 family)
VQAAQKTRVERFVFFSAQSASAHNARASCAKAVAGAVGESGVHTIFAPSIVYAPATRSSPCSNAWRCCGGADQRLGPRFNRSGRTTSPTASWRRSSAGRPRARRGPRDLSYDAIVEIVLRAAGRAPAGPSLAVVSRSLPRSRR